MGCNTSIWHNDSYILSTLYVRQVHSSKIISMPSLLGLFRCLRQLLPTRLRIFLIHATENKTENSFSVPVVSFFIDCVYFWSSHQLCLPCQYVGLQHVTLITLTSMLRWFVITTKKLCQRCCCQLSITSQSQMVVSKLAQKAFIRHLFFRKCES